MIFNLFQCIDLSNAGTKQALDALRTIIFLFIIHLLRLVIIIDGSITNVISPVKCMATFMYLLMTHKIARKELHFS